MVAVSGYRLGFAVLAVPGAAALVVLALLRRAAPHPEAYEQSESPQPSTAGTTQSMSTWRFSRRFWGYSAFTALTMLGYATFAILAYHLQVQHVVPTYQIPIIYAAAMGVDALAALASGWVYDRIGLRGLALLPVLAAAVPALSFSTDAAASCRAEFLIRTLAQAQRADHARPSPVNVSSNASVGCQPGVHPDRHPATRLPLAHDPAALLLRPLIALLASLGQLTVRTPGRCRRFRWPCRGRSGGRRAPRWAWSRRGR